MRRPNTRALIVAVVSAAIFVCLAAGGAYGTSLVHWGSNPFMSTDMSLNSSTTSFQLATGSEFSYLSSAAAAALGLSDTGLTAPGLTEFTETASIRSGSIFFGGIAQPPTDFYVTDAVPLPAGVAGVVGTEFLLAHGFKLSGTTLTINPDFDITEGPKGEYIVEMKVKGDKGEQTLKFEVDTGAATSTMAKIAADAVGLTDTGRTSTLKGVGGTVPDKAKIMTGNLDDLGETNFRVLDGIPLPAGCVGLLGRDVLDKRFSWEWDPVTGKGKIKIQGPGGGEHEGQVVNVVEEFTPEPLTMLSLSLGVGGLGWYVRKRSR